MKYNNCIIASLGASGTNFIAQVLQQDKSWDVYHERLRHKKPIIDAKEAQRLVNADKVCYINGFAWHHFMNIEVANKAVIIRDPYDIAVSWYNRRRGKLDEYWVDGFEKDLRHLLNCYKKSNHILYFDYLFSVEDYINSFSREIGINIKEVNIKEKVNHNNRQYAKSFMDLPLNFRNKLFKKIDWFKQKFYE